MSLVVPVVAPAEDGAKPPERQAVHFADHNLSLAERLNYRLAQFVRRAPLAGSGRAPLRLLAVPRDPIAGDKAAGQALLAGRFHHNGTELPLQGFDFTTAGLPGDISNYLQSFAWLRDLAAAATRERGAKLAETLARRWLEVHAGDVAGAAWRGDLWGQRLLFWTAYAPYILSSADAGYRSELLRLAARGARHLDRVADRGPQGLGRVTAWSGLIAAGLLIQGAPVRLRTAEAGLVRALASALHDDGGLVSRSPTEQMRLVETLAQLRSAYIAAEHDIPDSLEDRLAGAAAALLAVTLGDEALSSWQGGNMGSRRRLLAAIEGAGAQASPLRLSRGWGYQRLQAKGSVLVFDSAPPPPARGFAGGCASTLAFEFGDGQERLIVNCGGAGEASDALPPELVQALRTTAAFSTLTLGDHNSTAVHEDGSLGRGVRKVELARADDGGSLRLEASHDGYARRYGLVHRRRLVLAADGRTLSGEENLAPASRRSSGSAAIGFAARFHLAPAVEATATADGQGALLRLRGGTLWQFRCRGGALAIDDSLWIDGQARPHQTLQLVIAGETPPDGMTISWELQRAK
ncbi:MAG: heparinase II/III family protein [Sphingosinicella sp.]